MLPHEVGRRLHTQLAPISELLIRRKSPEAAEPPGARRSAGGGKREPPRALLTAARPRLRRRNAPLRCPRPGPLSPGAPVRRGLEETRRGGTGRGRPRWFGNESQRHPKRKASLSSHWAPPQPGAAERFFTRELSAWGNSPSNGPQLAQADKIEG